MDEASSSPIADVAVHVEGSELQALTDANGAFLIENVPAGPHLLVLEHLAYGMHSQSVAVTAGEELRLSARLSLRAIELAPLVVEGVSQLQRRRVTTGLTAMNEIPLADIDDAARRGLDLSEVLRQRLPGLRVRQGGRTGRASRGRFFPSALAGTMMASAGYLLLIEGKEGGSGAAETAGIVILTVGMPLALAISDRVFRSLQQPSRATFTGGTPWGRCSGYQRHSRSSCSWGCPSSRSCAALRRHPRASST